MLLRYRAIISALPVVLCLLALGTLVFAADSERDQVKAFKAAMKSREEGDRLRAVAEFASLPG